MPDFGSHILGTTANRLARLPIEAGSSPQSPNEWPWWTGRQLEESGTEGGKAGGGDCAGIEAEDVTTWIHNDWKAKQFRSPYLTERTT